jgi:hypothetical protein
MAGGDDSAPELRNLAAARVGCLVRLPCCQWQDSSRCFMPESMVLIDSGIIEEEVNPTLLMAG